MGVIHSILSWGTDRKYYLLRGEECELCPWPVWFSLNDTIGAARKLQSSVSPHWYDKVLEKIK